MLKIGDILYVRDENRRVYENDDGTPRRTPNPRHQWVEYAIRGENKSSWILSGDLIKVDKKTLELRGYVRPGLSRVAYTADQKSDRIWHEEHAHNVMRLVQRADVPTLRKIAELLGYGD